MQNKTSDMAKFLKNIIPSYIPKSFPIKPLFKDISSAENIISGVIAFKDFLHKLFDCLIEEGAKYDKPSKDTRDVSHPSLPVSFPFINNVKSILFNIGYHGIIVGDTLLIQDIDLLTSSIGVDGQQMKAKISTPKLIESFIFLNTLGIEFEDLDLNSKTIDNKPVLISYQNKPTMLIGLKVMAIAQKELYIKGNHDIFLRCDYRIIKEEATDVISILKDFVSPLSNDVQDFAIKLHQRYINAGLTCKIDVFYLCIRFIYFLGNKEVWTFSAAFDSGYRILIKAQNTSKYPDVIDTFPLQLQEKISLGYGCNKKIFKEPCQKGCHGFSFPLDNSIIDISQNIEVWIDNEIASYSNKRK